MKNNDSRVRVERTIAFYRRCAKLFQPVAEVIKAKDGKVLNVTLEKALRAATGSYIKVTKTWDWLEITYYERYGEEHDLVRLKWTDKRIGAKEFLASLEEHREYVDRQITDLELALTIIDERIEQIKKAVAALNALTTTLPYAVQEAYEIPNKIYF
jgi:hypothetical protein